MAYKKTAQHGGEGGSPFSDDLTQVVRLVALSIRHGDRIDAIQCTWLYTDGTIHTGARHGGGGGTESQVSLHEGEYIQSVSGRAGDRVDRLSFTTNEGRTFGPYGGGGGTFFDLRPGSRIEGFFGRSADELDAVGAFYLA